MAEKERDREKVEGLEELCRCHYKGLDKASSTASEEDRSEGVPTSHSTEPLSEAIAHEEHGVLHGHTPGNVSALLHSKVKGRWVISGVNCDQSITAR